MPEPGQFLCRSDELVERGRAVLFDLLLWGQPARGFALRIDGAVVAYVNRCAHVPTELDWNPGEFLDARREVVVCAVHGAEYEPASGRCLGGPCGRGRLLPIEAREADGEVAWYPSRDIAPLVFDLDDEDRASAGPGRPSP
ncbi:MAG TPA: Rieske 2Fe-2S domain-containing protein [Burkholderiaceae bacterium]|nr:Rieske 2Fe-2S domain-containing protein [Burkholderiaceae bacterium]